MNSYVAAIQLKGGSVLANHSVKRPKIGTRRFPFNPVPDLCRWAMPSSFLMALPNGSADA